MIARVDSGPWMQAWRKLEAFIVAGVTEEQITETPGSWAGPATPVTRWPTRNKPQRCSR